MLHRLSLPLLHHVVDLLGEGVRQRARHNWEGHLACFLHHTLLYVSATSRRRRRLHVLAEGAGKVLRRILRQSLLHGAVPLDFCDQRNVSSHVADQDLSSLAPNGRRPLPGQHHHDLDDSLGVNHWRLALPTAWKLEVHSSRVYFRMLLHKVPVGFARVVAIQACDR